MEGVPGGMLYMYLHLLLIMNNKMLYNPRQEVPISLIILRTPRSKIVKKVVIPGDPA